MNKADARRLVCNLTAASLRRIAHDPATWAKFANWPKDLTQADRALLAAEFEALAVRVGEKSVEKEPIDA